MSSGRRSGRTQPPPPPRRRPIDLSADLGTSSTMHGDEGVTSEGTESPSGTGGARVSGPTHRYEAPPTTLQPTKDEPAWKRTAELIGIVGVLLIVVATSAYLLSGLGGLESKVDDTIERVDSVATTATRIDTQVGNVQSSVNELRREVQELRRDVARVPDEQRDSAPSKQAIPPKQR